MCVTALRRVACRINVCEIIIKTIKQNDDLKKKQQQQQKIKRIKKNEEIK